MDITKRALLVRVPQLALAAVAAVLIARTPLFFSLRNVSNILNLASLVGVLAVGQAFVLIGGGFDLSQGAVLGLSAACAASWLDGGAAGPLVAGLGALAIGAGAGAVNGWFVAYVRTNPFVTTLSATLIVRGLTFLRLGGRQAGNVAGFAPLATEWSAGGLRVSGLGLIFLASVALAWAALRRTVFGQHAYATGGNAEAARLAGVRTTRVTLATFALSGLAAGLAAPMWLAFVRVAKADTGQGLELNAIAACVVGGVSLQGGRGGVLGAAAGCLLLQALRSLIILGGLPDEYSTLVTGCVILTFAAADALARRGERR
jgi:ribose transport system permease protein